MAKEIQAYTTTGLTLYAVVINSIGQFWNTSATPAFETYNGANWTDYDIALTEAGAGIYTANMPGAAAGSYSYAVYERAGASPATTDTLRGTGYLEWSGSAVVGAWGVDVALVDALTVDMIPDSVAADGAMPTIAQALYAILQILTEKLAVGANLTIYKPDGVTPLMTFLLNDANSPTGITRLT